MIEVDFESWYREAHPRLVAGVLVASGSLDITRDAVDEACMRALARWDRVGRMRSPTGWAFQVAINVVRRRARRAAIERTLLLRHRAEEQMPAPAGEAWDLVRQLPPRQRTVVALRFVVDLTQEEIATALGITRSTVASTLADALTRLGDLVAVEPAELEERDA